jgi:hypothetical protein
MLRARSFRDTNLVSADKGSDEKEVAAWIIIVPLSRLCLPKSTVYIFVLFSTTVNYFGLVASTCACFSQAIRRRLLGLKDDRKYGP